MSCWGAMAIAIGLCASAHGPRVLRAAALAAIPVASLSIYLTFSRFGVVATATAFLAAFAVSRNRWTVAVNGLVAAGMSAAAILIASQQSEIQNATGNAGAGLVISILLLGGLACATVAVLSDQADGVRLSRRGTRRALGAAALVTVLSAAALHGPISRGWDQFTHSGNPSGSTARFTSLGGDRYAYWRAAYHAFESDPGRGIGPGSFEFYWDRNGTTQVLIRNPHSLYLQKLSELGLAGFVAIVVALAGLLWGAIEARRRWITETDLAAGGGLLAAFVVFVVYAGVDWMWEMGAIGTLAMGGAAVVGASRFRRAAPLSGWARAGLTLLALVAAASLVPTLVSTERTRASATALAQGDPARGVQLADDAIRAEPWAASPYAQKALALLAEGRLTEARDEINKAIDREKTNWRWLLIRAQIDARAGDVSAARLDLVYAKSLAPRSPYLPTELVLRPGGPRRSARRAIPARRLISADKPLVFSGRPGPGAMERSPETRSLRDYLRAIKAHRWLVIGTTVAAIAASILLSVARTPVYEATATVSVRSDFNLGDQSQAQSSTQGAAGKEAALVVTHPAVLAAASRAAPRRSNAAAAPGSDVTATAEKDVNAVSVKAKADTAERGRADRERGGGGHGPGHVTTQLSSLIEAALKSASPATERALRARARAMAPIQIASAAVPPGSPTSPRPLRDAVFAALLGLLLGVGIALVRDALDRTVTDPHDLESTLGFPLLGYVRSDILGTAPASRNGTIEAAEHLDSFRILRANTQFLGGDRPLATLAVTSPLPDEGKSTVAIWYAYANALGGKRTILVECDLHRPVVAERLRSGSLAGSDRLPDRRWRSVRRPALRHGGGPDRAAALGRPGRRVDAGGRPSCSLPPASRSSWTRSRGSTSWSSWTAHRSCRWAIRSPSSPGWRG